MKVVILAGGMGTRISEESQLYPKPLVEIGGKPILWHIMKIFSFYGFDDFIICAGYRQHLIKEYFSSYSVYNSDITFKFHRSCDPIIHSNFAEDWQVTVVDTGYGTSTGGRILKIRPYLENRRFWLTYGDGVSDIDLKKLLLFHERHAGACTLTATKPESRYGFLEFSGEQVVAFREKSHNDVGYINSGFMIMEQEALEYIHGDEMLEQEPMARMVKDGKVFAYKHEGFWHCMDTLRDKRQLEDFWNDGRAPWKLWSE